MLYLPVVNLAIFELGVPGAYFLLYAIDLIAL